MKKLLYLFVFLIVATQLSAQPTRQLVDVKISPDHSDLLYTVGQKVKFTISAFKNNVLLEDVEVNYSISEDMMEPHKKGTLNLKKGEASIDAGTMKQAGFLRCEATVKYDGREYKGLTTVGFDPQQLKPVTQLPSDFSEFWNNAKAEAAKIPLDVKMTLIPERCTEKLNVYNVNIQNNQYGSRIYGVLCVPKGEGKYPAILKLPGAGVRGYNGDRESADKGYIVFEIGVHGIPVNLPGEIYYNLYEGALKGYYNFNLNSKDDYYYKRIYLGCVRAIDFIFTLPEFDGETLIAYGGSQGGALSIVTASLDNRVKALVSFYPALCDLTGFLHNRAGGWPRMFKDPKYNTPDNINTVQYYDVANFARFIKVPGFYSFGYNDIVCPPTSVYSAVNMVEAAKDVLIVEETGHYAYPEQRDASWVWLKNFLQTNKNK